MNSGFWFGIKIKNKVYLIKKIKNNELFINKY